MMQREQRPGLHTQEQKADLAKGKDASASQKRVVYQLQLLGCRFRRAVRKRGKKIILDLTPTGEGCPAEPYERAATADICDLLEAADAAICTIEKVVVMAQASAACSAARNRLLRRCSPYRVLLWHLVYDICVQPEKFAIRVWQHQLHSYPSHMQAAFRSALGAEQAAVHAGSAKRGAWLRSRCC